MNHGKVEKTYAIEDDIIDATLTALHITPPPTGLEDRLLQSLQTTKRVPHVSILRRGWTASPLSFPLWVPVSLAAAVLTIVFAVHHDHPSTPLSLNPTAAAAPFQEAASPIKPTTTTRAISISHSHKFLVVIPQRSGGTCVSPTDAPCPSLATTAPYEQAALANTLAPSQPAPPLPLTQQERLLIRILRRGDYTQLAELNPAVRSAREAQELADFQNFFPSPKPHPQPDSAPQTAPTTLGDKQ